MAAPGSSWLFLAVHGCSLSDRFVSLLGAIRFGVACRGWPTSVSFCWRFHMRHLSKIDIKTKTSKMKTKYTINVSNASQFFFFDSVSFSNSLQCLLLISSAFEHHEWPSRFYGFVPAFWIHKYIAPAFLHSSCVQQISREASQNSRTPSAPNKVSTKRSRGNEC